MVPPAAERQTVKPSFAASSLRLVKDSFLSDGGHSVDSFCVTIFFLSQLSETFLLLRSSSQQATGLAQNDQEGISFKPLWYQVVSTGNWISTDSVLGPQNHFTVYVSLKRLQVSPLLILLLTCGQVKHH